jgi:uridine kinase
MRTRYLAHLAGQLTTIYANHPLRVGIDGIDAAGKSILADELADSISALKRPVVRASLDGFHQPREKRYRQGQLSPQGYFQDSFQYDRLIDRVLKPLGPGGNRIIQTRIFDYRIDSDVTIRPQLVPLDAILIFDGIFLLRDELRTYWDVSIFVKVSFETAFKRAIKRDSNPQNGGDSLKQKYLQRYIPAQKRYLQTCQPEAAADFTWDNEDPLSPILSVRSA